MTKDEETNRWSIEIPHTSRTGYRGNIRRNFDPLTSPKLSHEGCHTLYEVLRRGKEINPLGPCLGYRATSTSGFATPYIYSSYTEVVARVDCFAAGLDRMGLLGRNEDGMLLLGFFLKNCVEWVLAEHGVFSLGGTTVPFYDTLGPSTVEFILQQTSLAVVIATRASLPQLCTVKKSGNVPFFRHVILVDGVIPLSASLAEDAGLTVVSFAKVEAVGAQVIASEGHAHRPPSGHDVATFCYTSGTTGDPKGALLTHTNMCSTCAMFSDSSSLRISPTDRHLSYLPLPHVFERIVQAQLLGAGSSIAFFRNDPALLIEDLQACQPTVLPVAPRVLNKIHDKIMAGIDIAGGMKKSLFHTALTVKSKNLKDGKLTHALYDVLIFNKVKKALGLGHIRWMVSGSAPLSEKVMTFFRCMLGVPVLEGYGQTEGTAAATLGDVEDMNTVGHVGGPCPGVEIVLVDVPEMGYTHLDTDHRGQPCSGRGEICIRGPNVFKGYYKQIEKTKEALDEEGWLHSGDIGMWTIQGQLKIIDRKKNIFKLSQGEYVAPEKIENIIIQSTLISQCFVYGDSLQSSLVAIIVMDEEVVLKWASDKGIAITFEELATNNLQLRQTIQDDIVSISRSNGLHGFEIVKAFHLEIEIFGLENGLTTPTFKLKRQQLRDRYQTEIDQMYASMPPPKSML